MHRAGRAIAVTIFTWAVLSPSMAAAQQSPPPPCDGSRLTVTAPAQVVSGRTVRVAWKAAPDTYARSVRTIIVTATPASGQPVDGGGYGQAHLDFVGPGSVQVTWHEVNNEMQVLCDGTTTRTIAAVAGRPTTPDLRSKHIQDTPSQLQIAFDWGTPCYLQPFAALHLTVSYGQQRTTARLADPCGGWASKPHTVGVLKFRPLDYAAAHDSDSSSQPDIPIARRPGVVASMVRTGNYVQRYKVTIAMGVIKLHRTLIARARYVPSRRIYWETDAFVNYCIDQNQTVYSYHGRLFCWSPGSNRETLRMAG